ncbi:MAG TPA: type II secretion system protein N [Rudaea sp.]|nr:type II secretion system protein N [Rudaea sp.]
MKLLRRVLLLLIVLAAVAGLAAWTCPADLAYRYFGGRLAPLALRDLSGTIWQGRATTVELFRQNLGALEWRLQPAPLLHGEAIAQLTLTGDGITATGLVDRGADGEVSFRDVVAHLPARIAAPVLAIPALDLLGTIEIDVAQARLRGVWLEEASGAAYWRDAAVAGAAQARLSDLQLTFASAAGGTISGVVHDLGGPLQADGTFSASLARYDAQVRLAARGDDPRVTEALQFVGQPQSDGSRQLVIEGRQLGLF